jgi:hypothetical protein
LVCSGRRAQTFIRVSWRVSPWALGVCKGWGWALRCDGRVGGVLAERSVAGRGGVRARARCFGVRRSQARWRSGTAVPLRWARFMGPIRSRQDGAIAGGAGGANPRGGQTTMGGAPTTMPRLAKSRGMGGGCLTMSYFRTGICTIIGAEAFHGPVRDGKGWFHLAMVVRR